MCNLSLQCLSTFLESTCAVRYLALDLVSRRRHWSVARFLCPLLPASLVLACFFFLSTRHSFRADWLWRIARVTGTFFRASCCTRVAASLAANLISCARHGLPLSYRHPVAPLFFHPPLANESIWPPSIWQYCHCKWRANACRPPWKLIFGGSRAPSGGWGARYKKQKQMCRSCRVSLLSDGRRVSRGYAGGNYARCIGSSVSSVSNSSVAVMSSL